MDVEAGVVAAGKAVVMGASNVSFTDVVIEGNLYLGGITSTVNILDGVVNVTAADINALPKAVVTDSNDAIVGQSLKMDSVDVQDIRVGSIFNATNAYDEKYLGGACDDATDCEQK